MAVFKVETKNKVDIDKKPRVYFTCHPDDFEKHFQKVCDDIFKTHDCAIYYTEDMTEVIAEDEKQVDLGRNNLFVIPVTYKLLTTPNRAMDKDIPYALKEHIPVLPIMMEAGIDVFYSNPDKFGELQYLNPYSTDLTEIPYEEKLKKYLESVLISDELAKRVRAAFDAYIFLSYRKKDRKYANELMRLIHSVPECRDIAIWFDEFLTPGESFKKNIEKILDDCKLFTLLVTPHLLEKVIDNDGKERDNYVIGVELPAARKKRENKRTDILAVEMEDTDKEALSAIHIEDCVNSANSEFHLRLLQAVSRMAITGNNTPEHDYLIGLAYLNGIDVEVEPRRAVALLETAAYQNLAEATTTLVDVYKNGIGVPKSTEKAIQWQHHYITLLTELCKENPDVANIDELFWAQVEKGDLCLSASHFGEAEKAYSAAREFVQHSVGYPQVLVFSNEATANTRLGNLCEKHLFDTEQAISFYEEALRLQTVVYSKEPNTFFCRHLALCYQMLANVYGSKKQFTQAETYFLKAIDLLRTLSDSEEQLKAERDIACCYEHLGNINKECGLGKKSLYYQTEALKLRLRLQDMRETDESLRDLYVSYIQLGHWHKNAFDTAKAEEHYKQALCIAQKRRVKQETVDAMRDHIVAYDSLSKLYLDSAEFDRALEYAQEAATLCRSTPAHTPEILCSLSNAYETIAYIWEQTGRNYAEIKNLYQQTLVLRTKVVSIAPTINARHDLSIAYENMGRVSAYAKQCEDAVSYYKKTLELRLQICEISQSNQAQRQLAVTYDHIGDAYMQMGNAGEAIDHYQKACDLRIAAAKFEKNVDVLYELSVSYKKIGDLFVLVNEYETAASYYVNMLHISLQLAASSNALKIRRHLMVAYGDTGKVFLEQNKLDEAAQMLQAAYQLAQKLEEEIDTVEATQDLITTLTRIAQLSLRQDNAAGAASIYRIILHYRVKIIEKSSATQYWDDFAVTLLSAAEVDGEKKEQYLSEAVHIYEKLCADDPENQEYPERLTYAKRRLTEA